MKEQFEAHRARMTPEERERVWSGISGAAGSRRGRMWRIPAVAVSALATLAVVVLMVRTDTTPDVGSFMAGQERALDEVKRSDADIAAPVTPSEADRAQGTRSEPAFPAERLLDGRVGSVSDDEATSSAGSSKVTGEAKGEAREQASDAEPPVALKAGPTHGRSRTTIDLKEKQVKTTIKPSPFEPGEVQDHPPVSGPWTERSRGILPPAPVPDEPPGAMTFAHPGVGPFVDTATDALSTFALDVDHASYTLARAYLQRGTLPPPAAIRVEEFVNAMPHDYAPPSGGPVAATSSLGNEDAIGDGTFAIHLDASESRFGEGMTLLRVGLKGREITRVERKPAVLTFVVDTSGSMGRENRIALVRDALTELLYQLDADDRVAIVAYGSEAHTILPMTTIRERRTVEEAIARLTPSGSTNAEAGLRMAYAVADEHYDGDATNRVILCSDGVANVGETDPDGIMAQIKRSTGRGITLTAIGVGMGNYNDALLERIANTGDGSYYYVDSATEAKRVFVEGAAGPLEIIARDAKVQVEFNPKVVERYRLLGYENRDVADQDFRNDRVDAGEIGAGHEVTALFELRLADDVAGRDPVATVRVRFEKPEMGEVFEDARTFRAASIRRGFDRMAPDFRLDAAVAELAEILRRSEHARGSSLDAVLNVAVGVQEDRPDAAHVAEVIDLVTRARDLVTHGHAPTWQER